MSTTHTPHGHNHDHSHSHDHDHGHPQPHHLHAHQPTRWQKWWGYVVGLVAVAIAGFIWINMRSEEKEAEALPASPALIAQMKAAAQGWVQGQNSFGGEIKAEDNGGKHTITVTGIPNKPCVETGWALAKDGQVLVNGVFLPRLSASKLAEVCALGDNKSTLVWSPK